MPAEILLEHEILSVLTDATDKTQKPFLKRVLEFKKRVESKLNPQSYFREILKRRVTETLFGCEKKKSDDLIDLFRPVLKDEDLIADIEFFITTAAYGELRQVFTFLMKKILISAICTRGLRIMNFPKI